MKFAGKILTVTPPRFLLSLVCLMGLTALTARSEAQTVSGIIGLESCAAPAQPVTFAFSSATQTYFFTRAVTLSANGSYALPNIPADLYHVRVKGAKWLAAVSDVDTRNGNATLNAALLTGDTNDDNSVDSSDFTAVLGAYNSSASIPGSGYDTNADLNCDGHVDSSDFTLLIGNYGSGGDELPAGAPLPLSRIGIGGRLPPRLCQFYALAYGNFLKALTGQNTLGYTSDQPEAIRFEDDFTPDAMQTHLILTTRNKVRVRIFNAPSLVQPAATLTAPGTVMYDATLLPAPSGPSIEPGDAIANGVHRLDVTLTAGKTYHFAVDYDATASFENAPDYAHSYGIVVNGTRGVNGLYLYDICAEGWGADTVDYQWSPYPPIQTSGIASVSVAGTPIWSSGNPAGSNAPSVTVAPGSALQITAATAIDNDTESTYVNGVFDGSMLVRDQINYEWSVSGASGQAGQTGSGQTFAWTAPTQPGQYFVTLVVDDADHNNSVYGNREDQDVPKGFNVTVAAPNATPGVKVDVSQQGPGTPNPACAGQAFTVNLTGTASGLSAGGASCNFTGHAWSWATTAVQYRADAAGQWSDAGSNYIGATFAQTAVGIVPVPTSKTDNPTAVTMSMLFTLPGFYKVTVQATDQYTSSNCGSGSQSGATDVTFQVVPCNIANVAFDKSSIKVGHGPVSGTQKLRAYVTPASAAAGMTFIATKPNEASVYASPFPNQSGNTAIVDLIVTGNMGTPVSAPNGDCQITANGMTPSTSPTILVLIPTRLSPKHFPFPLQPVNGKRIAGNINTSPAFPDSVPPQATLSTQCTAWLQIQVLDQFNIKLDDIYIGAKVEEFMNSWVNINQQMQYGGIYLDPVGTSSSSGYIATSDPADNIPAYLSTPIGVDTVIFGPGSGAGDYLPDFTFPARYINIRVDGNVLTSGVRNRTLRTVKPNLMEVIWPDTP